MDNIPAVPGAAVATVTVTGAAVPAVTFTKLGKLQVGAGASTGVMLQVRLTVPLNDPMGVTAKSNVALFPAAIVDELGDPGAGPIMKSGAANAVPETTTCCDPVPALSATFRFALDTPAAVGANVTLIMQLARGSTVVQLLVCLNSPASAPVKVTLVTFSATAPVLVSVTGIGLLLVPTVCEGKLTDVGENFAPGTGTVELRSTNALP
jgi:hypothetical protein